ncbi:MAG: glycosyltransferase family 87 protein [Acidimicrobiales bacterium]
MQTQFDHANAQPQQPGHSGEGTAEGWPMPALVLVVATGLVLGILLVYQGIHKGFFSGLTEVDDGVYYGEGLLMAHGVLPYHSYIDIQPPGIALLMAPFGLLARVTSERVGFEVARIFIVLVAVANVALLGRLIRRRHWAGVLTGLAVLAFYEDSLIADHTILLEPILVLTTLLAFLVVFDDLETATASSARWLGAGVLLGVCSSIKLWGIFPFVVLLCFAYKQGRRCLARFVAGGVVAFGIICLPFFVLAPSAFWHEVVVVQATRAHIDQNPLKRLGTLLGVTGHVGPSLAVWAILGVCVVGSLVLARRSAPDGWVTNLDVAAMACAVIVGLSFLVSPEFDAHYGGFLAPFMALVFSATAVRLVPLGRTVVPVVIAVVIVLFIGHSVKNVVNETRLSPPDAALDRIFSPHSCVFVPDYGPVILTNRYNLFESNCPRVVDPYGTELTDGGGYADVAADARSPEVQADWADWLRHTDGLVLFGPLSSYPDMDPAVKAYIRSNYTLAAKSDGLYIYRHVGRT